MCNSLLQLVLGLTAQLVLQNVAAPSPVESPWALELGPPVNTSGGTSPGLGVGACDKDNISMYRAAKCINKSIGSCVHMHGYNQYMLLITAICQ